jgi:hypothetical protein
MKRHYYSDTIPSFVRTSKEAIIGELVINNEYASERTQSEAWASQIDILQNLLSEYDGSIFFEYAIPRMGKRIDVLLIINNAVLILEFKVGEKEYLASAVDQVWDYALDLKNFHESSHHAFIAPVLIATQARGSFISIQTTVHNDNLLLPIKTNSNDLKMVIDQVLKFAEGEAINIDKWKAGRYSPTPTIIEAAMTLYRGHSVKDITRNEAANLGTTSSSVAEIILESKKNNKKSICFVTGVPGAGKTLVGLDIATQHMDKDKGLSSVYLSGNGPLVAILREALTRDKVKREKAAGKKVKKGEVMTSVKSFIQNVHHYRDEYLKDEKAPFDHVAIFDEAQRAWNFEQTVNFMSRKKGRPNFHMSEPEFLISCLDRHSDWAVIVCLVGGGQEINTGEAGISEWIEALNRSFPLWHIYISDKLTDNEYAAGEALKLVKEHQQVEVQHSLHLSVSLRSFRAENLSNWVKQTLDLNIDESRAQYALLKDKYPIVLTRDLAKAKQWLKKQARGSERYGLVVSSQAQRLKPHAIDVKSPMDPIHWFLDDKDDVRSSYYLEDVATEFHVQGLELDWTCVTWDGDFRYSPTGWEHFSFVGNKWQHIRKVERQQYLKNAYRVLLTRARQGMVIVVPEGDDEDQTRNPEYYDTTFDYLKLIGIKII